MNERPTPEERVSNGETARRPAKARTERHAWSCFRLNGDRAERLTAAAADGVEVSTWPITELSFDTIRARWGTGAFRLQYLDARGQACGRKLLRLTERASTSPAKPKSRALRRAPAPATTPADAVQAVVALMGVAQSQANVLVQQVRTDAQRSVDREREFMLLAMKQQETGLRELERIRRDAAQPRPPDPGMSAVLDALRGIATKLDDAAPFEDDDSEVEPLWRSLARQLAPQCAPGINAVLAATAPGLGALVGALAARTAPPPLLAPATTAAVTQDALPSPSASPEPMRARAVARRDGS